MRNFRTEGIIIKRRNFGEADRLITVLTRNHGKILVKAAGVRKITSRRSAHIELLNHAILNVYKGNNFPILTEATMVDDYVAIKTDFNKIGIAYHLCELVDGLCPENQENSNVFSLLKNTLNQLSNQDEVMTEIPVQAASSYLLADIQDYTIGTYGIGVSDAPQVTKLQAQTSQSNTLHNFEIELLTELGYWHKQDLLSKNFDTHDMIENILERSLKSKKIFQKLQ